MANENNKMSTLVAVEQYVTIYGPFILSSLGIIGNILSILIFLSPRYRRQSSHFYLLSLALSDLGFLIINLLEDTFRNHNGVYKSRINFLDRSSSVVCITVQYARNVTRSLSSWIIVSFTIERLLVVFYPLKRAIICRRKIARIVVLILFIICLINHVNVPFHYGIINLSNDTKNDTICDIIPTYRSIYMRFAISTMITVYLMPMCIIGVVNMLICCQLWRKNVLMDKNEPIKMPKRRHRLFCSQCSFYVWEFLSCLHLSSRSRSSSSIVAKPIQQTRTSSLSQYQSIGLLLKTDFKRSQVNGSLGNDEHQPQSRSRSLSNTSTTGVSHPNYSVCSIKTYIQSRTHRVTATLLLVSCSFLLLNTPYCAVWTINYVQRFQDVTLNSIKEITELFMLTNFCINFLLYCVSGKVFRSELICLLRCQWKELYGKNEGDRMVRRKSRPQIEIQLREASLKPRSLSLHPNGQQHRFSLSLPCTKVPNF